jgi:hypothetical protein
MAAAIVAGAVTRGLPALVIDLLLLLAGDLQRTVDMRHMIACERFVQESCNLTYISTHVLLPLAPWDLVTHATVILSTVTGIQLADI